MKKNGFKAGFVIAVLFFTALLLPGETLYMEDGGSNAPEYELRFMRTLYSGSNIFNAINGIYDLTYRKPYKKKFNIVISAPIALYVLGYESIYIGISGVYLGIQSRFKENKKHGLLSSVGISFPTFSSTGVSGSYVDFYRRYKYNSDLITLVGNFSYHHYGKKVFLKAEIGPEIYVPFRERRDELRLMMHYGLCGGVYLGDYALSAEFLGIKHIARKNYYGKDIFYSACVGLSKRSGKIRPGIYYSFFLREENNSYLHGILGVKVEFDLKK